MSTGISREGMRVCVDPDASSSGQMLEQKRAVDWTGLFPNRAGKEGERVWVFTALMPRFPSFWVSCHSPTSLAYCRCFRSEVPTLCLIEPLPGLLAALATLFVRWVFSFVFRVTFDSDSDVVLCGAALYLCFSRTVPLYPLRFFLVFVSFLNYT